MRILTGVILGLIVIASPALAEDDRLPNIVFLFADDLGYGDLACYGHPYAKTPNLDRLASQGTRFTQAYVTGITCCPSRTGYMTGKFPASFKKYPADYGFGNRTTITDLLKEKDYATGHFGKWHMGPVKDEGTYGIDRIAGGRKDTEQGRDAGLYAEAVKFIKANKDKPFYVNVWGHITHYPVNPPEHFADRFKSVMVNPDDFGPAMHEKFKHVRSLGKDVDTSMRNYLGDVMALDDAVGRLLEALDELGLADNTIVVFSSDHGAAPVKLNKSESGKEKNPQFSANMLGSPGPHRGGKHTTLEGGVRVPFIIRWPGNVPADRVDEKSVISGIDWLPTLCAITSITIDIEDFDGEDVSAAWLGKQTHARTKPLLWRQSTTKSAIVVRDGPWKLYLPKRRGDTAELYDVTQDLAERHNVAGEHPQIVEDLRARAKAWARKLPEKYFKKK